MPTPYYSYETCSVSELRAMLNQTDCTAVWVALTDHSGNAYWLATSKSDVRRSLYGVRQAEFTICKQRRSGNAYWLLLFAPSTTTVESLPESPAKERS